MGRDMFDSSPAAAPSFEALVAEHLPSLRRRAARMCKGHRDADDIVQDALVRALKRRDALRAPESARGWLLSIVSSTFIDQVRRRRARPQEVAMAVEPADEAEPADEPSWSRLSMTDICLAVEQLPDDVRDTFRMFALEGRDYVAIAAIQGVPKATVGTRIHRARRRLRELLQARLAG